MAIEDSLSYPIDATDPLAEIAWSRTEHVEVQYATWFQDHGLQAKDPGGEDSHLRRPRVPIILKDELGKQPGESVRMRMRRQLTNTPRTDSNTYGNAYLPGNEQALSFYDMTVWLALLKNAVGHDTPDLYNHRTSIDMEGDAEVALREWLVENTEEAIVDTVYESGPYFAQQSVSGVSSTAHPNKYRANGATDESAMGEAESLTHAEIRRIRAYCIDKKLNPIKVGNKDCFAVLGSVYACNTLDLDPDYRTRVAGGQSRGDDNPLISGAVGHYNNLYVHEYQRVRQPSTGPNAGNLERLIVLGGDAVAVVFGSEPRITVRKEDAYGDRWGRAIRHVFGAARTDWAKDDDTDTDNQSSAEWVVYAERDEFAQ